MQSLYEYIVRELTHWAGVAWVARSAATQCGSCEPSLVCPAIPDCVCGAAGGGRAVADCGPRTFAAAAVGLSAGVLIGCCLTLWAARSGRGQPAPAIGPRGAALAGSADLAAEAQAQLRQVRARRNGGTAPA